MDMNYLRRRMFAEDNGGGGIPKIYTPDEYLEANGKQFLNTGFVPHLYTTDEMLIEFSVLSNKTMLIFGTDGYNIGATNIILQVPSVNYRIRCDMKNSSSFFGSVTSGQKCTFTYADRKASCLGETFDTSALTENNIKNLFLFSQGDAVSSSSMVGRIYRCTYKTGGELVLDLVPCYRNSDNTPGFYNLANGEFITNGGTEPLIIPT